MQLKKSKIVEIFKKRMGTESNLFFTKAQIEFVVSIVNELVEDPKVDVVKDSLMHIQRAFYQKYGALKPFDADPNYITPNIRNSILQFMAKNNLTYENYLLFLDWAVELVPHLFSRQLSIYDIFNAALFQAYLVNSDKDKTLLAEKKEISKKKILLANPQNNS